MGGFEACSPQLLFLMHDDGQHMPLCTYRRPRRTLRPPRPPPISTPLPCRHTATGTDAGTMTDSKELSRPRRLCAHSDAHPPTSSQAAHGLRNSRPTSLTVFSSRRRIPSMVPISARLVLCVIASWTRYHGFSPPSRPTPFKTISTRYLHPEGIYCTVCMVPTYDRIR